MLQQQQQLQLHQKQQQRQIYNKVAQTADYGVNKNATYSTQPSTNYNTPSTHRKNLQQQQLLQQIPQQYLFQQPNQFHNIPIMRNNDLKQLVTGFNIIDTLRCVSIRRIACAFLKFF